MSDQNLEDSIARALKRIAPKNWLIHEEFSVERENHLTARPTFRVNFAVQSGNKWAIIEAKANRFQMPSRSAFEALGILTFFQKKLGQSETATMIVVSMHGISDSARRMSSEIENLELVGWNPGQDDRILAEALHRALDQ